MLPQHRERGSMQNKTSKMVGRYYGRACSGIVMLPNDVPSPVVTAYTESGEVNSLLTSPLLLTSH